MKKLHIGAVAAAIFFMAGCTKIPEPMSAEPTMTAESTAPSESTAPKISGVPFSAAPLPQSESETAPKTETDTATEAPPIEDNARASVAFVGDTTQSDIFGESTLWRGTDYPFGDVAEIFRGADLAFVNLETSVSDRGESEKPEGYGFRTDPALLEVYTNAGIDLVSCANNHTRDYGMDALSDTFLNLSKSGLRYIGAGENLAEAEKLEIFELNGIKAGFTACNMINMNPTWYAGEDHAGLMCVDFADCGDYLKKIEDYDKKCDVLFVSVHWGIEYSNAETDEQREFAHMLCDSGADIILGHHPHVLQPIEEYNGSVIFYSLGNFLFYKMDDDAGKTALFKIEIDRNGFVSGRLYPVFINYCKSNLLSPDSEMYGEIIGLVRQISEPYGVVVDENGGIEISR